ncbi:hypothetical protein T03_9309 [Trichinella britovi]|uniref:Uncharacterized protein n=1 Tax=Trichinella britovi TaxID=45882 RepID=A0A0V1CUI7_TRIBR|nr:hypothetical protein T03_9309 [Trichinella britovi]
MHCYVGEDHQQKENNPTVLENNQADGPSRAVCLKRTLTALMNPSSLSRSQFSLSLCTECQRFPFPPFSISATSTKPIFHHYPLIRSPTTKSACKMTTVRLDNTPRSVQ